MDEKSSMEFSSHEEEQEQEPLPVIDIHETSSQMKNLTIKIGSCNGTKSSSSSTPISISPHLNSPSPPSSAFVSALQSPYISPRATEPELPLPTPSPVPTSTAVFLETSTTPTTTLPSPTSISGDDIPSSSYTPPSEKFSDSAPPRVSFSFPVPRVSFTKTNNTVSPSSNTKLRSCDVYIGFHGQSLNLARFCKWLKSELELQGIASFVADRAKYSDSQSHEIADRIICSAAFGVVLVTTPSSFCNPFSVEEIKFFAQKKNLIPLLFDTDSGEVSKLNDEIDEDKDCKEAIEGVLKCSEFKLETNESNWRSCISKTVAILTAKLGRKSIAEKVSESVVVHELPFYRNKLFVGREKETAEIEAAFFGFSDAQEPTESTKPSTVANCGSSDGFADEESEAARSNSKFISLEMKNCKEPTLEAWIENPLMELSNKSKHLQRQRSKHKKPRAGYNKTNVVCINGASGSGKTEIALEFAYRYSQRYKSVLWVGGEARYFRQNILNLSMNLGIDVSAESEKDRGRIQSFEEQEFEAFQRVKRELFRDIPYLLIVDNLETEREWWEGKDLHDLIPRNTGATNVIITTRLLKVMNFEPMQLQPLSPPDSLVLLRGRRKKDYPVEELEVLRKFDARLNRLSFGLSVIGSLLSELSIRPSALFDAIERINLSENLVSIGSTDDQFWRNNSFLMKVMVFGFAILDRSSGSKCLASRMALAGAWLAPEPVSSTLLATIAYKILVKGNRFDRWRRSINLARCLSLQSKINEADSASMLVKLGFAKKCKVKQPSCWIQFHEIVQMFARRRGGLPPAKATVLGICKSSNVALNSDHLWASAFLVFGFKSEPPIVQLKAVDMVLYIKKTALPLAIRSFTAFSRCNSALELLKVCTNLLEEVEKSFVSRIQDWQNRASCWNKKAYQSNNQRVDEYVWQDVTLLKATLLETRAKLLMRGGHFDTGEELCRTCISIRTVMLGHNHAQTLAAQETLARLVRLRSKV